MPRRLMRQKLASWNRRLSFVRSQVRKSSSATASHSFQIVPGNRLAPVVARWSSSLVISASWVLRRSGTLLLSAASTALPFISSAGFVSSVRVTSLLFSLNSSCFYLFFPVHSHPELNWFVFWLGFAGLGYLFSEVLTFVYLRFYFISFYFLWMIELLYLKTGSINSFPNIVLVGP